MIGENDTTDTHLRPYFEENEPIYGESFDSPSSSCNKSYTHTSLRYKRMTREEEFALVKRIKNGDLSARSEMVEKNMGLVYFLSRQYKSRFIAEEDLIQEGYIGLLYAVDRFKPNATCQFPSYAQTWVRSFIQLALIRSRFIRLPDQIAKRVHAIQKRGELLQDATDISDPIKKDIAAFSGFVISMDHPTGDFHDRESQKIDPIDEITESPCDQTMNHNLMKHVRAHLNALPAHYREILTLRFGWNGRPEMTLDEIGERIGSSRESARQLQNRALDRLKRSLASSQIFQGDL